MTVSFVLESSELDTFHVWPHKCYCKKITSLDLLGILLPVEARMSFTFSARAHCWLMVNSMSTRPPLLLLCQAASQLDGSQHIQGAGLCTSTAELHEVSVIPFLQPFVVLLDGSTTLWCISHSSQFGLSANLLRVHSASSAP